jgi:hypothetical protein
VKQSAATLFLKQSAVSYQQSAKFFENRIYKSIEILKRSKKPAADS